MPNRESARNGVALLAACSQAARYGHVPEVGCTGGLFTPTMNFGALLGGYLGQGWSLMAPGASKDIYAIVGEGQSWLLRHKALFRLSFSCWN